MQTFQKIKPPNFVQYGMLYFNVVSYSELNVCTGKPIIRGHHQDQRKCPLKSLRDIKNEVFVYVCGGDHN